MPVVINEFEVVPDGSPPPKADANRNADSDATKRKEKKPDFETVLRHWYERAERVHAH